jgi:hypothetical protein
VRAIAARKWFEFEAPRWAQPLPLSEDDCTACFNGPERWGRRFLTGKYGLRLRDALWHRENVPPFEVFCADTMRPRGFYREMERDPQRPRAQGRVSTRGA